MASLNENFSLAKKYTENIQINKTFAIFIILVYGTDSTPKRAIPRGIPRFPVFPTSAVARYID